MAKYVGRLFKSLLTTFKLGKFLEEIQTVRVLNKFELDPPHHQFIVLKSGETLGRSIFILISDVDHLMQFVFTVWPFEFTPTYF
jgi:hypothetical protein